MPRNWWWKYSSSGARLAAQDLGIPYRMMVKRAVKLAMVLLAFLALLRKQGEWRQCSREEMSRWAAETTSAPKRRWK